jgi:hypothetical protein
MLDSISLFLGIAVSMLLIFVILDKNYNLYNKIVEEIKNKLYKALNNSEKKVKDFNTSKRRLLKEAGTDTWLKDKLSPIWKGILRNKKKLKKMGNNIISDKTNEALSILQQAPLYTALFCLLVSGIDAFLLIFGHNYSDKVNVTLFYFVYFSWLSWIVAWIYRSIIIGHYIAFSLSLGNIPRYRDWFTRHTVFSSLFFPVTAILIVWGLILLFMRHCDSSLIFIVLSIMYLLFGILCYLAKEPDKDISYINFYGQIVMIMAVAVLTDLCSSWFNIDSVIPVFWGTSSFLKGAIYFFIFLNGFTCPVLMPTFWFSLAPSISSFILRLRLRFYELYIKWLAYFRFIMPYDSDFLKSLFSTGLSGFIFYR